MMRRAGVWLGTNGCFQVWTKAGWLDAAAGGVVPAAGVEYTFRFVFDYRSRTYSASVQYGAEWRPLAADGATAFPLAVPATCISRLGFSGDGLIRSILGQWFSGGRGLAFSIK